MSTRRAWDDVDAPVIMNTAGALITWLDAILVDGYGTQPPLGWSKPFASGNVAVYRNDQSIAGSSGMYLHVDDSNATYAIVKTYKTMSDINTGTDLMPNASTFNTPLYWVKHGTGTPGARPWYLYGDALTFYFMNSFTGTPAEPDWRYSKLYGVGDFISFVPGDTMNYMLLGSSSTSYSSQGSGNWPISNNTHAAGTYAAMQAHASTLNPNDISGLVAACPIQQPGDSSGLGNNSYTAKRIFAPPLVTDAQGIRGLLRGARYLVGRSPDFDYNFGPMADDPMGPDWYCLCSGNSGTVPTAGIVVSSGDWGY